MLYSRESECQSKQIIKKDKKEFKYPTYKRVGISERI